MYIHKNIVFEWDEVKNAANQKKHGIWFSEIHEFDWDTAAFWRDERDDYGEERHLAIGSIGDRLHIAIYTKRGDKIRIISLRKANDREKKVYEKALSDHQKR